MNQLHKALKDAAAALAIIYNHTPEGSEKWAVEHFFLKARQALNDYERCPKDTFDECNIRGNHGA